MRDSYYRQHPNPLGNFPYFGTFIVIILIGGCWLSSSCATDHSSHAFKVYDCVIDKNAEPWENPNIYKIEMVGKHSYLVKPVPNGYYDAIDTTRPFGSIDDFYEKTACPQELEDKLTITHIPESILPKRMEHK